MCKRERKAGDGTGQVTIGSVAVPGRWRYSYVEGHELPGNGRSEEEFKFIVALTLTDRKKLVHLKKGDWTELTADPFRKVRVYLSDIEYNAAIRPGPRGGLDGERPLAREAISSRSPITAARAATAWY